MTRARITIAVGLLLVLVRPAPARAQRAAFLDDVRALGAVTSSTSGDAIRAAAARMQAALAQWDRSIATLERQVRAARGGDPNTTAAHVRLAIAYGERGRLDDALR
ncbi:MAG TPA: hypothetical protein VG871_21625, partial [Vicinamibacterales bacterium]|nr:hypothetical protein [Vicinamibacterales bacterium]